MIILDRIEVGMFMIVGVVMGKEVIIDNVIFIYFELLMVKLREMGYYIEISDD